MGELNYHNRDIVEKVPGIVFGPFQLTLLPNFIRHDWRLSACLRLVPVLVWTWLHHYIGQKSMFGELLSFKLIFLEVALFLFDADYGVQK